MKKHMLIIPFLSMTMLSQAQDIMQSQVPSVVVNIFHTAFPKATDVEWEMDGMHYNVEFETGWNVDHEIWYTATGEMVRHKEDIPVSELPTAVRQRIDTDFSGYSIDDLERITEGSNTSFKMELNSLMKQDWDVVIGADGTVLNQMAD